MEELQIMHKITNMPERNLFSILPEKNCHRMKDYASLNIAITNFIFS